MAADGLDSGGRTRHRPQVTRAELELAIRAELVDFGATGWHARVAADYVLGVVDEYLQARGERFEARLKEVLDAHFGAESAGERIRDPDLARWILEDYQRAVREDLALERTGTSRRTGCKQRSPVEGG